jgi:hypothetical protein
MTSETIKPLSQHIHDMATINARPIHRADELAQKINDYCASQIALSFVRASASLSEVTVEKSDQKLTIQAFSGDHWTTGRSPRLLTDHEMLCEFLN